MEIKTKKCRVCNETKSVFEYTIRRAALDGLESKCNACKKATKKRSELEKLREQDPQSQVRLCFTGRLCSFLGSPLPGLLLAMIGPRDGSRTGPREGSRTGPREGTRTGPREGSRTGRPGFPALGLPVPPSRERAPLLDGSY